MQGIILIGITNHKDKIDSAFLRKGRFDTIINMGLPKYKDQIEIINYYIKKGNLRIDTDINTEYIVQKLDGMPPADIKSIILENKYDDETINKKQFIESYLNAIMGEKNESIIINEIEKKNTSVQEAGHALLTYIFDIKYNGLNEFDFVNNIPRANTLGISYAKKGIEYKSESKERLLQHIAILLGGKGAQKILLHYTDSGASNDIEQAYNLARKMIRKYGMGKKISGQYNDNELSTEINTIITTKYKKVIQFFTKYKKLIEIISKDLMEKNILYRSDMIKIVKNMKKIII